MTFALLRAVVKTTPTSLQFQKNVTVNIFWLKIGHECDAEGRDVRNPLEPNG
jgi:hypothetical protein